MLNILYSTTTFAGTSAYAVAEARRWRGTLGDRVRISPKFYAVVAVYMLLGLALDIVGINAVKILFYTAILNGVLVPLLIVLVALLTRKYEIMGIRVSSRPLRYFGWATAAIMTAAVVGMFATM